ncbi:MAG: response regulator [Cyclobacteriaceae bacterium]
MKNKLNCVLLVDDDQDCNFLHQRTIQKVGCTDSIEVVLDGEQALKYLNNPENQRPDLIFLDVNMPKVNGWDFLEEYAKIDENLRGDVVIVMLTTSLNPEDFQRAQSNEFVNGFVNKYLEPDALKDVLKENFPEIYKD